MESNWKERKLAINVFLGAKNVWTVSKIGFVKILEIKINGT